LRYYGDPVLTTPARTIERVDESIRALAQDMLDTMYAEEGIGLAAPQVGESLAICVVDVPRESDCDPDGQPYNPELAMPLVLVNPEIAWVSEREESREEGCLSFPDVRAPIRRPVEVTVRWTDLDGQPWERRLRGLVARCVQHELDHLKGILLTDRMSPVHRIALAGRLKRLRKATENDLRAAMRSG